MSFLHFVLKVGTGSLKIFELADNKFVNVEAGVGYKQNLRFDFCIFIL